MLPISKLRGVPPGVRVALKAHRVTTCGQLLAAAGRSKDREALAARRRLDPAGLTALVQRADLARVEGVGTGFGLLLERLGVRDVAALAEQAPEALLARLRELNARDRLTRRSPTAAEVGAWVERARALPRLVTYPPPAAREAAG
jgi:nucleotidyltransferase/DNA polymerase involved in DNA repair